MLDERNHIVSQEVLDLKEDDEDFIENGVVVRKQTDKRGRN